MRQRGFRVADCYSKRCCDEDGDRVYLEMALVTIVIGLGLSLVLCREVHRHSFWRLKGMISLLVNCFHGLFNSAARNLMPKTNNSHDHSPIYRFHDPPNPKTVIIFFHDIHLGAEYEQLYKSSWMSNSDPPVCWPETWLRDKYLDAQILSACYDSGIQKTKTTGHMDLYKIGENLRQDILPIYTVGLPIIMVGHGLGGLVIKAFIREIQEKSDALAVGVAANMESSHDRDVYKLDSFLKNVKSILYYATPFLGSKLMDSMNDLPFKGLLLSPLQVLSNDASRLNYWFSPWQKYRKCNTKMIWAGCPTGVDFWYGHLVEEASARYDIGEFYTVSCDHFNVCKPEDMKDIRFRGLTELIDRVMASMTPTRDAPIKDNVRSACVEYMEIVFSLLAILEPGDGLKLKKEYLDKIRTFNDLSGCLIERLKKAGLEFTCDDAYTECWEPVY